jgi:hypothetical protein
MNILKTICTMNSCMTVYDKVLEEIRSRIVKAQRLNEKMQQYLRTIIQCDDDRENISFRPRDAL